jgi:carbon monoxide dehydrogenase subunit G
MRPVPSVTFKDTCIPSIEIVDAASPSYKILYKTPASELKGKNFVEISWKFIVRIFQE